MNVRFIYYGQSQLPARITPNPKTSIDYAQYVNFMSQVQLKKDSDLMPD